MAFISICIPTYEMNGKGAQFLTESFEKIRTQTYKDFEVVISDHSISNVIESVCDIFRHDFPIHYIRNEEKRGNSSANLNCAIRHAEGTLIKILFQDDFLYTNESLAMVVQAFQNSKSHWLVSSYLHSKDGTHISRLHIPRYNPIIHLGYNTIGTPSGLTILNQEPLLFDENLIWLMDCDYYARCYQVYGAPNIINSPTIVNRISAYQITSTIATKSLRKKEYRYILHKYHEASGFNGWLQRTRQKIVQKVCW